MKPQLMPKVSRHVTTSKMAQARATWFDMLNHPQLEVSQMSAAAKANPKTTPTVPKDCQVACAKNIQKPNRASPMTACSG